MAIDNGKINDAIKKIVEEKKNAFKKEPLPALRGPTPFIPKATAPKRITKDGIDQMIVAYYNPKDPIVEQFRALRTYIYSIELDGNLKTLAITSSSHQEGKSISAVNLSVVIAQDSKRSVLIIDCNLRKPAVDILLGLNIQKGLSDILTGNAQINDTLIITNIKNLTVLPAGRSVSNPTELLGSQKIKDLLTELRVRFDYIILDTPPVVPYADTRILGPLVDGVIIVVRTGKTRREVVLRTEETLKSTNTKLLGYILTDIKYYIPEYIHRHL